MTDEIKVNDISALTVIKLCYEDVFGFKHDLGDVFTRAFIADINARLAVGNNLFPLLSFEIQPHHVLTGFINWYKDTIKKFSKLLNIDIPEDSCDKMKLNIKHYATTIFTAIKHLESLIPQFVQVEPSDELGLILLRDSLDRLPSDWNNTVFFIQFGSQGKPQGYLVHELKPRGCLLEWDYQDETYDTLLTKNCIEHFVKRLTENKKG